jgi:hypothetical protein
MVIPHIASPDVHVDEENNQTILVKDSMQKILV